MVKTRYGRSEDTFFFGCEDKKRGATLRWEWPSQLKLDLPLAASQLISGAGISAGSEGGLAFSASTSSVTVDVHMYGVYMNCMHVE